MWRIKRNRYKYSNTQTYTQHTNIHTYTHQTKIKIKNACMQTFSHYDTSDFFVVAVHLISSPSSCLVAYQLRTLLIWRRNVSVNARKNYKNMKYVDEHNKNACGNDNTTSNITLLVMFAIGFFCETSGCCSTRFLWLRLWKAFRQWQTSVLQSYIFIKQY